MKLVLDTNIYCDYAEGIPDSVDMIAKYSENIYIPSIVIGELKYGFLKGGRPEFNEKKLKDVISSLKIDIIDINQDVAGKYAMIYLSLVKKGEKIPINDVWIAACCMEIGGTLITRDKHFNNAADQIGLIVLDEKKQAINLMENTFDKPFSKEQFRKFVNGDTGI